MKEVQRGADKSEMPAVSRTSGSAILFRRVFFTRTGVHFARKRSDQLFPERIGQLPGKLARERRLVLDAVVARQPVRRHPEGAEQDIPERKGAGKIGIA